MPRSQYRERDGGIVSSAVERKYGRRCGLPVGHRNWISGRGNAASQHKKAAYPPGSVKADGNLPSEGPPRGPEEKTYVYGY